jgi:8-oxo-dGTP diphosphatase/2-hydroxy-dATP diphosphatase
MTLCFARRDGNVLLGRKKRGFGEGKWNGYGGKVQEGEAFEDAARREWFEETGCEAREVSLRGVLRLEGEDETHKTIEMRIFAVTDCVGEPAESDEMEPRWFSEAALPYADMWPDDPHWMPLFLSGKCFLGVFRFDGQELKTWEVTEVMPAQLEA